MREHEGTAATERGKAALLGAIGSSATVVAALVRSKVVAVELGPSGTGVIAEVLQYATLALTPVGLVLGPALLRRLAFAETRATAARDGFALALLLAAAGAGAALLTGPALLTPGTAWSLLALAVGWQTFQALLQLPVQVLTVQQRFGALAALNAGAALALTGGIAAGVLVGGLRGQFLGALVSSAAVLAVALAVVRRSLAAPLFPRQAPPRDFAIETLRTGATGFIGGLAIQLALIAIREGALRYGGSELVGQFQASWTISTTYFTVLLTGLLSFAFPRFATATPANLGQEMRSTLRFFMLSVPPLLLGAIAVRTMGMKLLYDERFNVAADILGYQLAGDILRGASWILAGPLLVRGQLRAFLLTELVGAVALAGLVWALLPTYGPAALGLGYVLGYAVYGTVVVLVQRHTNEVHDLWPAFLACAALTALALVANWWTTQSAIASPALLAVSALAFFLGPARKSMLARVRALASRLNRS